MTKEHIEKLKQKIKEAEHIDDFQKNIMLEKLEEWSHDKEAVAMIPNLLKKFYEKDIKPILDEMGFTD
jgi:hypothetical protein